MKNKPLDFQVATAEHVLDAYKKGQRRVLVADEAGLGKTTVASEVVRRVKEELAKEVLEDDGLYCIVYVCCNLQIAQQNIDTLSDDGERWICRKADCLCSILCIITRKQNCKQKARTLLFFRSLPPRLSK